MTYQSPAVDTDYWNGIVSSIFGVRQGLGLDWVVGMTGDSRAQANPLQTIGGAPCYNYGMPGIAINEAVNYIPAANKNLGPRVSIVQIGINLCFIPLSDPQWSTVIWDTRELILGLLAWSPHVVLTTPIPYEKGFPAAQSDADCVLRCSWLDTISFQMVEAANALGIPVVDLHGHFRQTDGTAVAGTTWDGTHFTKATYQTIKTLLDPVVAGLFAI